MAKDQALPMEKNQGVHMENAQAVKEPEHKWTLFINRAFKDEEKEFNNQVLLEIATEFYSNYHDNPMLLEKLATLFSSKHTTKKWEACLNDVLTTMKDASKINLFQLKLSNYDELHSNIQTCVHYCSLFPKDYTFNKMELISLWASQEHLLATPATNLESVGDEYFEKLLKKGYFFESIQGDGTKDILGYKMPYLVNEFLREIAKPEFCLVDDSPMEIDVANILHISFIADSSWKAPSWMLAAKNLRSLLFLPRNIYDEFVEVSNMDEIFKSSTCLQALDLVAVNCEHLPSSFGDLKDLRYLRLGISLGSLPQSIIRLEKLQTLDIRHSNVMELPRDFHKFKYLRHLYVGSTLIHMPPQILKLKSLNILDMFVVGKSNRSYALRCSKLAGKLTVRFDKDCDHDEALKDNNLITDLSLIWLSSYGEKTIVDDTRNFSLPPTLESLAIRGWKGEMFGNLSALNKLVSLCIEDCNSCKNLPQLSILCNLRSLQLSDLKSLEYIEKIDYNDEDSYTYFPSLKYVMLDNLQQLKGWSNRKQEKEIRSNYLQLKIKGCPKMMSIPRILKLESLEANSIHEKLLEFFLSTSLEAQNSCLNWWRQVPIPQFKAQQSSYNGWIQLGPSSSSSVPPPISKLQNLDIVSILELDSTLSFSNITESLTIKHCPKLLKILDFKPNMNSLQQLVIHDCSGLQDIASVVHLSALKKLEIKHCEKLNLGDDNMIVAWKSLQSLHSLKLIGISNLMSLENGLIALQRLEVLSLHSFYELKSLPEWIGKLTPLHHLDIQNCPYLITLPESLGDLSSLQQLEIQCCPLLKKFPILSLD